MKILAEKMGSNIPIIAIIISVIVSWLIMPLNLGFPMVAFFIFFVSVGTLIYMVKQKKSAFDILLYVTILILACFTIYRANGFLQFFDIIFIIFFGSLLITPINTTHSLLELVISPFRVFIRGMGSKNIFPYEFSWIKTTEKHRYIRVYLPTIAITLLILLITVPLLASANPFFNALLQNFLSIFNLQGLLTFFFGDELYVYVLRLISLIFLLFFIPRALTITKQGLQDVEQQKHISINYLIPKITLSLLLIIFFITQIQLYFASAQTLQSLGYTNSRLTNEIFFQVTIVAFIVFLLTYFDRSRKIWNAILTYFLTIEAFFLVGIAFKSVFDYTSLWGFTHKRLWGFASMIWLTGILGLFVYHYKKVTANISFLKQSIVYTIIIVFLINILNFDYLIYHVDKPHTSAGIDYTYLSWLSTDAHSYEDELNILKTMLENNKSVDEIRKGDAYQILFTIEYLRNKYHDRHVINSFNISEYQEYLATNNINIERYRSLLSKLEQKK